MLTDITCYSLKIKGQAGKGTVAEVKSPFSQEVVANVVQADEAAVKAAITAAHETFHSTMKSMPAHQRSRILFKTAALIEEKKEDFARTIALEGGKPVRDARVEVSRAVMTFTIAAEEALRIEGEQIPMDRQPGNEGRLGLVVREPIGVIGAITPFNFPLNLVAHKLAPAFAAGCTVVLKPSSQTPVAALKLAEVLETAGLPDGALQVVPCPGSKGAALVCDPRLSMLTFTGSQAVGWKLREQIAPGVRIILELGGNGGLIVHSDANIELAARAACKGGYVNAGQTCISVQRIYVQETVYERFVKTFLDLVKELQVGDPLDEAVDVGPMVDVAAAEKSLDWIKMAAGQGAEIAWGGQLLGKNKNLVAPTVLLNTRPEMLVICQEVFAPIVSIMKYDTIDNAIEQMNNSCYGLQAGIFSQNIETALKAARLIDAGGVMINDVPTFRADHMPYGGRKESGIGLEGVKYAIHEMTQPKFICINLPPLS